MGPIRKTAKKTGFVAPLVETSTTSNYQSAPFYRFQTRSVWQSVKPVSTQEIFGRLLTGLGAIEPIAERMVTMSPDVSVSTNLGGWINKFGVFSSDEQPNYLGDDRLLRWNEGPQGRHVELGLSEMNLFLALHAFGLDMNFTASICCQSALSMIRLSVADLTHLSMRSTTAQDLFWSALRQV